MAHLAPCAGEGARGGHVFVNGLVEFGEVVAGDSGEHVVFCVPVHVPVKEFGDGVEGDGADAATEVGDVRAEAAVHGEADEVFEPVGDEDVSADEDGEDGIADEEAGDDDDGVEEQQESGPGDGAFAGFGLILVEGGEPIVVVAVEGGQDDPFEGVVDGIAFDEVGEVDGEQLQEAKEAQGGGAGQDDFAIALGVEGVAVVIGVAHGVFVVVPPAEQAVDVEEGAVEGGGFEDGAVGEFVHGEATEEGADRAVAEQGDGEGDPPSLDEAVEGDRAGSGPEGEMADGLGGAAEVASPHERAELIAGDGGAIPLDAEFLADLGEGCVVGHGGWLRVEETGDVN